MAFIIGFLVAVAIIGVLVYLLVIHREVPGAMEQRFGVLEALPEDIGKWKVDTESEEGKAALSRGINREVRLFHDVSNNRLVRQVRYKNPASGEITRVDPDEVVKRKRVRS